MIISIQPDQIQDGTAPDGTPLYRLPYPFHITDTGQVERQDFWGGAPKSIVGFQNDPDVQRIDLWWADVVLDPQSAVGKYAVFSDADGTMWTNMVPIESVTTTPEV